MLLEARAALAYAAAGGRPQPQPRLLRQDVQGCYDLAHRKSGGLREKRANVVLVLFLKQHVQIS